MDNQTVKIEVSLKTLIVTSVFIVSLIILWKVRIIFFMLFLAFIINSTIRPLVDRMQKYKIPRMISVSMIYILLILVVSISMATVISQTFAQLANLISEIPVIISNLGEILSSFVEKFVRFLNNFPGVYMNISSDVVKQQILSYFETIEVTDVSSFFKNGVSSAITIINSTLSVFFGGLTVMMISVYMLTREDKIYVGMLKLIPARKRKKYIKLFKKIETKLGDWLRGQSILMFSVGISTWLGLMIPSFFFDNYNLHEFALPLAFFAAFLEVIPNIGPFVTGFIGVIIALGSNPLSPVFPMLYVLGLFTLIQQFEGIVLVPKVMQKTLGLDPVITIISVIAAFILFDIIGAILVIPFLAIVQIIIQFEMEKNHARKKYER